MKKTTHTVGIVEKMVGSVWKTTTKPVQMPARA